MTESLAVLVAGGTGGVGVAVLKRLLRDGHPVTASYRDEGGRDRALAELGEQTRLTFVRCDVTAPVPVQDLVASLPSLDAVVNLVGGFSSGAKVHETPPGDFDHMLSLNLTPSFLLARSAVPRLLENRGSFLAVSSRSVGKPFAGAAGYLASKAALTTLIESLDVEYGGKGLRANVLLPGTIDTPANRSAMPDAQTSGWVRPEHFADAVSLLLSADSVAIRGALIPLTGTT